jgi:hypothetical protein
MQQNTHPSLVMVGEILHRGKNGISKHIHNYNTKVDQTNSCLRNMLQPMNIPNCYFWEHSLLRRHIVHYLHEDGKHLKDMHLRKYYRSVRGAILEAIEISTSKGYLA